MAKDDKTKDLHEYIDIQREIIVELRAMNRGLLQNEKRLLEAVQDATERLHSYRGQRLEAVNRMLDEVEHIACVPGCRAHGWDDKTGFFRKKDA